MAAPTATPEHFNNYGYDNSGRLASVTSPAGTFTYAYTPGSSLIASVNTFPLPLGEGQGEGAQLTVTNTWKPNRDVLDIKENRITSTNTVISSFNYGVNNIGQRTGVITTGTAFPSQPADWNWGYDALGQVTSADSPDDDSDRAYTYDLIGNRKKSADGAIVTTGSSATIYDANNLNQYSQISVQSVVPIHDQDGNATSYTLPVGPTTNATLAYDGENRLISVTTGTTTVSYTYDSQSRRVARTEGANTTVYLYDAWNCIAEYTLQNSSFILHTSNTWGLDLSGSLQGAGGVGGLLSVTKHQAQSTDHFYPTYDGNGNVSEYLTASGSIAEHYEYDTFGRTIVANGPNATDFAYRFSTKPRDPGTGLYCYGYRWYDTYTGRWLSRDPIGERGGVNLYGFVGNAPVNWIDALGLYKIKLVFNAFISGQRGDWLDEPMGGVRPGDLLQMYRIKQRQFRTDLRHFGEFSESSGNARLYSIAEIDSEKIGKAKNKSDLIRVFSKAGESHQRTRHGDAIFGSGSAGVGAPPPIMGYKWTHWTAKAATATVDDAEPEVDSPDNCTTTIKFAPESKYPFVSVFGMNPSPEIDYEVTFTLTKRTDVSQSNSPITVILSGTHDAFPDYEGYVQDNLIYSNFSSYGGPGFISLGGVGNRVTIPENIGLSLLGR